MLLKVLLFFYFILFSSSVFSKDIPVIVITAGKTPQSKSTVGSDIEIIDNKTLVCKSCGLNYKPVKRSNKNGS